MIVSIDSDLSKVLRNHGLRPTRQRVAIAQALFGQGNRHVSAELVHEEMQGSCQSISLATIYNTLNQFTEAGLLRQISIDSHKSYFDTNTGHHHHYYLEAENQLVDIPGDAISVASLPDVPDGMMIDRVDVVVRLKPIKSSQS